MNHRPIDIRVERLRRGLSRAKLAETIGVSEDVIRGAEEGRRPRPDHAVKIADFFNIDVLVQWPIEDAVA